MQIIGTYQFPKQTDIIFTDPFIDIRPSVQVKDPEDLQIFVEVYIPLVGNVSGPARYIDINPVPVENLDYNQGELVARILTRLEDFKVEIPPTEV